VSPNVLPEQEICSYHPLTYSFFSKPLDLERKRKAGKNASIVIVALPVCSVIYQCFCSTFIVQDVSCQTLDKLRKRPKMTLPEIGLLGEFLDSELPENLKIPLTQYEIDMLKSDSITDPCSLDDLRILFRVSDTESATKFCSRVIFTSILYDNVPPDDGTENNFITFWDTCIRNPLELLIPDGSSIRNSNKGTSTNGDRPDYGFILSNVCPFRGEEKSSINTEDPKVELGNKLLWTYDPAPYVLGKILCLFQDMLHTKRDFLQSQVTMPKRLK
jgi:hypothetical protein